MKQSERIQCVKNYYKHPLRKQYEEEKKHITEKPFYYHLYNLFVVVTVVISAVLFFYYGYVFNNDAWGTGWGQFFGVIILGLINIICGFLWIILSIDLRAKILDNYNFKTYKKLKEKYKEKGLIVMEEEELYEHECCEYDDWKETYVCSATKQPLSYRDLNFCKQAGNCRYCRLFVTAYLGPDGPKYWSYEFKK